MGRSSGTRQAQLLTCPLIAIEEIKFASRKTAQIKELLEANLQPHVLSDSKARQHQGQCSSTKFR